MPNNVYIGSRYVPIFDGDWDNTKTYEPLTIVNYNGGSYTSKQTVPAGTLPTNTTYWALTGNYNGQISYLQQQINDMNDGNVSGSLQNQITANKNAIDDLEEWEDVCGVFRFDGTNWNIINNSTHVPKHITSLSVNSDHDLVITFDKTFSKVGAGVFDSDEQYAAWGVKGGCSIGVSEVYVSLEYTRSFSGGVKFDGGNVSLLSGFEGDLDSVSYNNGVFTIVPKNYTKGSSRMGGSITVGSNNVGSLSKEPTISFSGNGNIDVDLGTLTNSQYINFFITFTNKPHINADNAPYVGDSNFWFMAKMKN